MAESNYISALKSKKIPETQIYSSERKGLLKTQDKKCSRCNKHLREYYYKFVKNPKTQALEAVCADCLITVPERKSSFR